MYLLNVYLLKLLICAPVHELFCLMYGTLCKVTHDYNLFFYGTHVHLRLSWDLITRNLLHDAITGRTNSCQANQLNALLSQVQISKLQYSAVP